MENQNQTQENQKKAKVSVKEIVKVVVAFVLVIAFICALSDMLIGTHIYSSIFCSYYFAEDDLHSETTKIVYDGTLAELSADEPGWLDAFIWRMKWSDDDDSGIDHCRLECDDYVIVHYMAEIGAWDELRDGPTYFTYMTPLPDDVTYPEGEISSDDIGYLVTDVETNKVFAFSKGGLLRWLKNNHNYPY